MLLACGDSFTYGSECLDLSNRWSTQLSNRLGMEEVNIALPGGSNSRGVRVIVEHCLKNSNPDLIVMLWTFPGRQEYMLNYEIANTRWHDTSPAIKLEVDIPIGNPTEIAASKHKMFQEFSKSLFTHTHNEDCNAYLMYKDMQYLQLFCKAENIKYIPMYTYNSIWLTYNNQPYYMRYPWLQYMTSCIDDFFNFDSKGYVDWCKDMGFKIGRYLHPMDDANIAAADYMYKKFDV